MMAVKVSGLALLLAVSAHAALPSAECARCHNRETAQFNRTGMARALAKPGAQHGQVEIAGYSYSLDGSSYTASAGGETLRVVLDWAFGDGAVGQTYLYRTGEQWHEARVSYYTALKGLDLTLGTRSITPHNLSEGAGRPVSTSEARQCFECHATDVPKSGPPNFSAITPGIQCERCHGSAATHVSSQTQMKKLGALSTEEMSDFCGQCHRTWADIAAGGPRGIENVRFQPYRLANSKCYDATDDRIRCTACHDPHRPLEMSTAAYDPQCLACHADRAKKIAACPVAKSNCAGCHMAKIELPGSHKQFTDHWIRVVRAGAPYPF